MPRTDPSPLAKAVQPVLDAMSPGNRGTLTSAQWETLRRVLAGAMRPYAGSLSSGEAEDCVDESLLKFLEWVRDGKLGADDSPAGLLYTATRNRVLSQVRKRRAWGPPSEDLPDRVERLERLVGATASRQAVVEAMAIAAHRRDGTVVRVVAAWLDLADVTGSEPTSRAVATQVAMSHTGVSKALARFRGYFIAATRGASLNDFQP